MENNIHLLIIVIEIIGFKSRPANSYERVSFLPKLGLTSPEF